MQRLGEAQEGNEGFQGGPASVAGVLALPAVGVGSSLNTVPDLCAPAAPSPFLAPTQTPAGMQGGMQQQLLQLIGVSVHAVGHVSVMSAFVQILFACQASASGTPTACLKVPSSYPSSCSWSVSGDRQAWTGQPQVLQ